MQCFIYRSTRKEGLYLYLAQADDFSKLPESIVKNAGELELALELELTADKKLRRENATAVLENLHNQGYHIQMPESIESLMNNLNKN